MGEGKQMNDVQLLIMLSFLIIFLNLILYGFIFNSLQKQINNIVDYITKNYKK